VLLFACLQHEPGSPVSWPMAIRLGPLLNRCGEGPRPRRSVGAIVHFPMTSTKGCAGEMACSQSAGGGVRCRIEHREVCLDKTLQGPAASRMQHRLTEEPMAEVAPTRGRRYGRAPCCWLAGVLSCWGGLSTICDCLSRNLPLSRPVIPTRARWQEDLREKFASTATTVRQRGRSAVHSAETSRHGDCIGRHR
jgi:hypothetical protein